MIEINTSLFKSLPHAPMKHQLEGVRAIVRNPAFYIGDKPRTGKSRQIVDASCVLRDNNLVRYVIIVGPVAARGVWCDKQQGQIKTWSWKRSRVVDFHSKLREVWKDDDPEIDWIFVNYEFIRNKARTVEFCERLRGLKEQTLLVLDESANLGNRNSQQSESIQTIRGMVSRCVMLNGSDETPDRYWSQFNILDKVLSKRYKNFTTYKWQFATWGEPVEFKKYNRVTHKKELLKRRPQTGWKNYDKLSKILAPYTLRRERKDCSELKDLPVITTFREVALSAKTWKMYKELKRDALLALASGETYLSPNAGVRLLRLAQICSGHLGGFEVGDPVRNFSSEKIDFTANSIVERDATNIIAWCRWIRERELLAAKLRASGFEIFEIHGDQNKQERRIAEMIFANGTVRDSKKRYGIIGQPQAGGICLDMSAASEVYRLSADYNLRTYEQSQERPCGPAQQAESVFTTNIIAVGPNGERSVEHAIFAALEQKENIGKWTTERWRKELEAE